MNTIKVALPKGGELEVDASPQFLDLVRDSFNIPPEADVPHEHIVDFIQQAFSKAIQGYENQSSENLR